MEKNRIKAFTLIEMVLTMMLAAIVIGMTYTAYTLFSRLYGGYSKKNLEHADVRAFRQMVDRDLQQARQVTLDEGLLNFKDSSARVLLSYQAEPGLLLRFHGGLRDTFKLKDLHVQASFEGIAVAGGITDQLKFSFRHDNRPVSFSAMKHYGAAVLFNYQDSLWNR